jgi:hypothetical protein
MRVEWDQAKNQINQTKHDVDFETAQLVFDDPCCVTFVERVTDGEERWQAIGSIENIIITACRRAYVSGRSFR